MPQLSRTVIAFRVITLWLLVVGSAAALSLRPAALPEAHTASFDLFADSTVRTVDWRMLSALNLRTGEVPPSIRNFEKVRVRIPGFIVPLEDFQENVKEFLLVPYFGACIHTPPPPPNQMVYVTLKSTTRSSMWDPVWIEGTLEVKRVVSPYGSVYYRMKGERITPYRHPQ